MNFESDSAHPNVSFCWSGSILVTPPSPTSAHPVFDSCRSLNSHLKSDGILRAFEEISFFNRVLLFLLMVDVAVECNSSVSVLKSLHDDCISKNESVGSYFTCLCAR